MKIRHFFLASLFVLAGVSAQGQEETLEVEDANGSNKEAHHKYKLAFALGLTHIPEAFEDGKEEDAVFVPTIGLDFYYHLNPEWSLVFMADLELGKYNVPFNQEELERERVAIFTVLGAYEVLPNVEVLIGGGFEFEEEKNLFVVRAGVEYEFALGNDWGISPSLLFDFKEDFNTWALAVSIGKRF